MNFGYRFTYLCYLCTYTNIVRERQQIARTLWWLLWSTQKDAFLSKFSHEPTDAERVALGWLPLDSHDRMDPLFCGFDKTPISIHPAFLNEAQAYSIMTVSMHVLIINLLGSACSMLGKSKKPYSPKLWLKKVIYHGPTIRKKSPTTTNPSLPLNSTDPCR